jgi:hypothetical protein
LNERLRVCASSSNPESFTSNPSDLCSLLSLSEPQFSLLGYEYNDHNEMQST